jgi:hypothetical protein
MPLSLSPADKKLYFLGGGVLFLLIVGAAFLSPSTQTQQDFPTSYSTDSKGAKAFYLLLKETGYHVERWEDSPTELKGSKNTTLILADPKWVPTLDERRKFREFVSKGGRVITSGSFASFLIPEDKSAPEPLNSELPMTFKALVPSAYSRVAPEISLAAPSSWGNRLSATPLYGDSKATVVVQYSYGQGEVIWMASSTPLTNAGVRESGNLSFMLTAVGDKKTTHVLFDEYFHGHRRSLITAISHKEIKWLFVQFAVVAFFAVLTYSRRSGPVRALASETRLSPLEFVDTLGGLYEHAGASVVAVDVYYQRFRYWLTRRAGVAPNASIPELQQVVRDRWQFEDDGFVTTLQECEEARYNYELSSKEALRLVQTLQRYAAILNLFPRTKEKY